MEPIIVKAIFAIAKIIVSLSRFVSLSLPFQRFIKKSNLSLLDRSKSNRLLQNKSKLLFDSTISLSLFKIMKSFAIVKLLLAEYMAFTV
ncbi:hypothetical protein AQUCO_00400252v1 [Aquilegia coerulea]|uniref:Uncharacterized protein n=1 Tax=Aquilegia coerulea TaxID=218851 RepID=A0A2G5EUB4_AQUCA|nr:hypothetical protein AQUCO_00400252v1 [Aquilegia coerulea]